MSIQTFNLDGKVAIITGSTKGIGYGMALGLASAGAHVVIVSRSQHDCDMVVEKIKSTGGHAIGVATDVLLTEQISMLVEKALKLTGKIDILVNNAGTAICKRAEDITEAEYDRVINLNQRAVFLVAQAVGREMIKHGGGRIINVSSIFGLISDRMVLPYSVAKGGVVQMTKALALEWSKYNIQVNAICPGYVITSMNERDFQDEKIYNHVLKSIPMRRLGKIGDFAGAAVFLASDAASYMTGQCLVIDGGWTAQ